MMTIGSIIISVLVLLLEITFGLDAFVLLSLGCQFILLVLAPLRKNMRFMWPMVSSVYLLESFVANYVMGSIPNYYSSGGRRGDLRVFWAPFVILHLGGPNTITSLSLDDNELWLRNATRFLTLSYSFGLVVHRRHFLQNDLWWPTALMFLAGTLRYFEKAMCRFLARLTRFRESTLPEPDPGVNYAELMEMYSCFKESNIPVQFQISSALSFSVDQVTVGDSGSHYGPSGSSGSKKQSQVEIVKLAYRFFEDFQGLFVNSVYTYNQRDKTRHFFLRRNNPEEAFSICEAELNFAYDVFYTKAILTHNFRYSQLVNLLSLTLQLASLVFWIRVDKSNFKKRSVAATHFLIGGSIAFVLLSLLMFSTSDWCITKVIKQRNILAGGSILSSFYESLLRGRADEGPKLRHRWSKRIPQLNLLSTAVYSTARDIYRSKLFADSLRDFIFRELVIRSYSTEHPKDVEELNSSRGCWILDKLSRKHKGLDNIVDALSPWISDVGYEESVILWHIATTLCYYSSEKDDHLQRPDLLSFSKVISDYMLSLLIDDPEMMPPSAGILARIIFEDTCAECRRFCNRVLITPKVAFAEWRFLSEEELEKRLREACGKMLDVDTDTIPPRQIRGDDSKALLFDACVLAKKLRGLKGNKWEVISKVLAEMLFYNAVHSSPSVHLDKLIQGGELLTLVWLLMAHLGLGKHFRHKKRTAGTAQFVINKHI